SLSLSGTRIRESVDLSDTLFGAPNFAHARFEGRAQFAGAEFYSLDAIGATFVNASFASTRWTGWALFDLATFGPVTFAGARADDARMVFSGAVFDGFTSFQDVHAGAGTGFYAARFRKGVDMSAPRINGPTFSRAVFEAETIFADTWFGPGSDFTYSTFASPTASLSGARLEQPLLEAFRRPSYDFTGAYFRDRSRAMAGAVFEVHAA